MGHKTGPQEVTKRKYLCPRRDISPDQSARNLVATGKCGVQQNRKVVFLHTITHIQHSLLKQFFYIKSSINVKILVHFIH